MLKIITVYNSLNYGSFLQAIALKVAIESLDKNLKVYFFNTKSRHPYKLAVRKMVHSIKNGNLRQFKYEYILFKKYREDWKMLDIVDDINKEDFVITGSDEIWNIHKKDFLKYPVFWGLGIRCKKIISYAVSSNMTTYEEIINAGYPIEALKNYSSIGVRDKYTQELVSKISNKAAIKVLDPTFLLKLDDYSSLERKINIDNYILIYGYNSHFEVETINLLKKFAAKENIIIVAAGFYQEWCDLNIAASPLEFLSLVKNAKYVISGTFHGTVFSIIYNKKFVVISKNNPKIIDLIEEFELNNRLISDTKVNFINELISNIDYNKINNKIMINRKASMDFLKNNIF